MIFAWACRLGTFLFMRVLKDGHDKRFNEVRDNPGKFFVYWSIQVPCRIQASHSLVNEC